MTTDEEIKEEIMKEIRDREIVYVESKALFQVIDLAIQKTRQEYENKFRLIFKEIENLVKKDESPIIIYFEKGTFSKEDKPLEDGFCYRGDYLDLKKRWLKSE